ncbi:hypothetical protein BD311DRAFT_811280 [Dichomitus squalens]|uniref:Uncharacterized protein n=1 Tax=Dichomitus squalens TaxID=114155 RepID=A0A4V2JYW0_9APHY|nr:hypothetical protein BD311DRAFT_811280 [Dichomitus squalens]
MPPPFTFPTASSFRAHAEKREQRQGNSESTSKVSGSRFNPAAKIYEAASQLKSKPSLRRKKRHVSPPLSDSPSSSRRTKKPASSKQKSDAKRQVLANLKTYRVCLVERTSAVHKGRYRRPTLRKLEALDDAHHVQVVRLPKEDESVEDINSSVDDAFKPHFSEFEQPHGWVLLNVKGMGSGHQAYLKVARNDGQASTVDGVAWARATSSTSVRGGNSAFKNLVYIALKKGSRDLPLEGFSDYDDDSDECSNSEGDVNSPSDGKIHDEPATKPRSSTPPLTSSAPNATQGTSPTTAANTAGASDAGKTSASEDTRLHAESSSQSNFQWSIPTSFMETERLLHNMQAPDEREVWWHSTPETAFLFSGFFAQSPMFELAIQSVRTSSGSPVMLPLDLLLQQIEETLLSSLVFLEDLVRDLHLVENSERWLLDDDLRRFSDEFALGPYGLHGVVKTMRIVYDFLMEEHLFHAQRNRGSVFLRLEWISIRVRAALKSFRYRVERQLWDPVGGFRDVRVAFTHAEDAGYLKEATRAQWRHTKLWDFVGHDELFSSSADHLLAVLVEAFGHDTDPHLMNHYALTSGGYGVEGLFNDVINPILDVMPLDHPSYQVFYDIMERFASTLALKLRSAGKKAAPSEPTAPSSTDDHDGHNTSHGDYTNPERPRTRAYTKQNARQADPPPEEPSYFYVSSDESNASDGLSSEWEIPRSRKRRRTAANDGTYPDEPKPDERSPQQDATSASASDDHNAENDPPASERPELKGIQAHEQQLANAAALKGIRSWKTLVAKILQQFPHPKISKLTANPQASGPMCNVRRLEHNGAERDEELPIGSADLKQARQEHHALARQLRELTSAETSSKIKLDLHILVFV